ncbi:M48 family metalloprotease [Streptomyces massasporeus]|uniref:M48 family metalloprotease n=1 Tax=Streptomyces massasporeus TaxID=67324 RepID=UPI0033E3E277
MTRTAGEAHMREPSAIGAGDGPVRRGSMFGLPGETTFLFILLVTTVTISCSGFLPSMFASTTDTRQLARNHSSCLRQLEAAAPPTAPADIHAINDAYKAESGQAKALGECLSPARHRLLRWQVGGLGLVLGAGVLLYLAHPRWYVRRRRLRPLTSGEAADLLAELDRLRHLAGVGRVRFFLEPCNSVPSAFVFGLPRRRALALSTGMVIRHHSDPAAFRAVVLHEMAHLRNRDIEPTYLALTLTAVFGLVLSAYSGMWLASVPPLHPLIVVPLAQALLLGILALLLLAALVRSREFQADTRAAQWEGEDTALPRVLRNMPTSRPRGMRALRALHPTPARRVQGLSGTMPPFGLGYWGGVAMGLTATVTLLGLQGVSSMGSNGAQQVWTSVLPGVMVASVLVVGRWRYESVHPRGAPRRMWPLGLGLATGTALSPVVAPRAYAVPDTVRDLLLWLPGWVLLVVVATVPATSWTAEAVAAWYRLTGRVTARPSRGHRPLALFTAIAVAAVGYAHLAYVLMVGTNVVGLTDNPMLDLISSQVRLNAPAVLLPLVLLAGLPSLLLVLGAVVVLLLAVNVLWRRLRVRPGPPDRAHRRTVLPAEAHGALRTGLAGGGALALLILSAALQAHRLPLAERWHSDFLARFSYLQLAAVVAVAAATAVVAVWRSRTWPLGSGALAAVVCVSLGTVAVLGQVLLGNCVDVLEGPVSERACLKPLDGGHVWTVVQMLVGWTGVTAALLLPPCAALRGQTLRARAARSAQPSRPSPLLRLQALPWRRRVTPTLVLSVASLLGPSLLVQQSRVDDSLLAGVSVGDAGLVGGDGYRLRMVPGWYDTTGADARTPAPNGPARLQLRLQRQGFSQRATLVVLRTTRSPIDRITPAFLGKGGRPTWVAGARALLLDVPAGNGPNRGRIIVVERGDEQLRLEFTDHATNWNVTLHDVNAMLASWEWTTPGSAPATS